MAVHKIPVALEVTDGIYNRLMDEIVESTGGSVQDVIDEITRLGLHRPGVGKTIEPDPEK